MITENNRTIIPPKKSAAIKKPEQSFERAMEQVPPVVRNDVVDKIKKLLAVGGYSTFYHRMSGAINHNDAERIAIEGVFAEYNITDVWGFKTETK